MLESNPDNPGHNKRYDGQITKINNGFQYDTSTIRSLEDHREMHSDCLKKEEAENLFWKRGYKGQTFFSCKRYKQIQVRRMHNTLKSK